MKNGFVLFMWLLFAHGIAAQQPIPKPPVVKKDNYTVQYLIIFNDKREILLQKNNSGWHTLAFRSTENQSVHEGLDSLAASIGLSVDSIRLAGLFTYKFDGLPDHQNISFRTHFTAQLMNGTVIQPADASKSYHWVSVAEAMTKITFGSLRLETSQILKYPRHVWGGSFLIMWQGDTFLGSKVLEAPYPLTN